MGYKSQSLNHILRCFTHYGWLIFSEFERYIIVCAQLPMADPSNYMINDDNKEFEAIPLIKLYNLITSSFDALVTIGNHLRVLGIDLKFTHYRWRIVS